MRTVRGQPLHLKPRRLRPARVEGVQWRVTAERAIAVPRRQTEQHLARGQIAAAELGDAALAWRG